MTNYKTSSYADTLEWYAQEIDNKINPEQFTKDQCDMLGMSIENGQLAWERGEDKEYFSSINECISAYFEGCLSDLGL